MVGRSLVLVCATALAGACGGTETDATERYAALPDLISVATIQPVIDQEVTTPISTPTAHAGDRQETQLGDWVQLDGRSSFDDNGEPLSYIWSLEQRPTGSHLELGEDAPIESDGLGQASFLPDHTGTFGVGLVVDDGHTRSNQAFATIRVLGPDERPIVHCATSTNARAGQPATFDASGSVNPLAHVEDLEFYWEPAALPEESRCLGTVSAVDEPTLSFVPDVAGRYVFVVQVRAAGIESEPVYVWVDVAP